MKRAFSLSLTLIMLMSIVGFSKPTVQSGSNFNKSLVPANEGKIAAMLMKKGVISKNATQEEALRAVDSYLNRKMSTGAVKSPKNDLQALNTSIDKFGHEELDYTNLLHGKKLGKGMTTPEGASGIPWTGEVKKAKLLILLAEFSDEGDRKGPLHNTIERPGAANNADLWLEDFSTDHYNRMLFTPGGYDATVDSAYGKTIHLDSMADYYTEQSGGSFSVEGNAYGWYKVPHSEAYYGDNTEEGTDDLAPGDPRDLVKDVLDLAAASGDINFADYDLEDPYDLDNDGDFYEPDGIIDRLVIVHAGVDESGGGGAEGTDAIWAHSWALNGLYQIPGTDMGAYEYTMQGENGDIGVFCHEFAHNLGLPDEYDTLYSGNGEAVGFYSLMASGSWTGSPLGTKPAPLSPYGKMMLQDIYGGNWAKITNVNSADITKDGSCFKLDQSTTRGSNPQIIKVNLPAQSVYTTAPYEGSYDFYSQNRDNLNTSMITSLSLPSGSSTLDFWIWYNVEEGYDYGYVDVSTNGGTDWTNLRTYNGSSGGWINEKADLSAYAGQNILLRFNYTTDGGYLEKGIFLDQIKVVDAAGAVIFEDNAENGMSNWIVTGDGWICHQGIDLKEHYYLMEYRTYQGTDEALNYGYNWVDYAAGTVEFYKSEPGLLVWYKNGVYNDNWVGLHPGYGYLGIVDSHSTPLVVKGIDLRTRLQIHDAAFSQYPVPDMTLTLLDKLRVLQGKQAVPELNDAQGYWNNKSYSAGLILPHYGLRFKVAGYSADNTTIDVALYR